MPLKYSDLVIAVTACVMCSKNYQKSELVSLIKQLSPHSVYCYKLLLSSAVASSHKFSCVVFSFSLSSIFVCHFFDISLICGLFRNVLFRLQLFESVSRSLSAVDF